MLRTRLGVINNEDATVALSVQACLPEIAAAIDIITPRLASGGRVIYTGAGTSGRCVAIPIYLSHLQI